MKMTKLQENAHQVLRQMTCELGHLTRPDGSTTLFQGDTCVITSVYGPGEVRMNKEQIDQATVDIVYKPKSGLPGCAEKATEHMLRNTCKSVLLAALHPRSAINITIQEVQNSGSFLAACINCCCLSLLDASVSMRYTMAAVHCGVDSEGVVILDPTTKQEENCQSTFTFVFDSLNKDVITVLACGKYSADEFQTGLATCRSASESVFQFYRETMKRKLSKTV